VCALSFPFAIIIFLFPFEKPAVLSLLCVTDKESLIAIPADFFHISPSRKHQ
jgi:hypothetical protein